MNDDISATPERHVFLEKMQKSKMFFFLLLLEDKQQFMFGVVMTDHLTLFLACFSVIFSRFYQQIRGVLEQLSMILGHLLCFLYLSMQFYSS